MKIGVWLSEKTSPNIGGGFSYYDILIENIDKYKFSDVEVAFISTSPLTREFQKDVIIIPRYKVFLFNILRLFAFFVPYRFIHRFNEIHEKILSNFLIKRGIRIIFYPTQGYAILHNFPFITNNWDIGHRETYAFPELMLNRQFYLREKWYGETIRKALLIFCESEAGKKELLHFTEIRTERIKVMPTFPGRSILKEIEAEEQQKILEKFNLKRHHYFFYPAQFWAHKNHYGLLQAFIDFHKQNRDYKLILTGSDKGNLNYIKRLVAEYKMDKEIIFGGFVKIEEVSTLYRNAVALIMPTFFGPTNMPLLEAMALKCPVLCSDFDGHREIMEDAALYFSPTNTGEIVECMRKILDSTRRDELLKKAQQVYVNSKFNIDTAMSRMDGYFSEIINIRNCWE